MEATHIPSANTQSDKSSKPKLPMPASRPTAINGHCSFFFSPITCHRPYAKTLKLTGIAISNGKIIQSPAGGCCAWLTTNQQDMGSGAYVLQVKCVTAESTQHQPSLAAGDNSKAPLKSLTNRTIMRGKDFRSSLYNQSRLRFAAVLRHVPGHRRLSNEIEAVCDAHSDLR